jgi:insulysin
MFNGMKFHSFTLDNQLQVLAISHDQFVKSSAALAVMAGSMQNPHNHLGLAHFLEHMLFLGTEDFPKVGDYEDFLNKNGGGHNAYTSIDHTNYFFDVTHGAYEGALRRFSRFFVNPTFDEKYLEREINAVHSEHEKNLKDDSRREYRFLQLMTDPKHPFSFFATGDKSTLSGASRDVVMEFYKSHYSSNLMRLVMMSPSSGQEMEELARTHFSDIPNSDLKMPEYEERLFVKGFKPQFHEVETIRDKDFLKVSFDILDDLPFWKSKPTQFLAHLLGEEGEGSLLSHLKKRGWALGLETSTWWRMFHVKVHLTEAGKENYEEVLIDIFSCIERIKKEGLKDYIFNERKVLAEIELSNMEPQSSMGRASQFSASMLYFPVDSFLEQFYLYHEQSEEDFQLFLKDLNPQNMQVSLFSKRPVSGKVEPFYGIAYRSEDLGEDLLHKLEAAPLNDEILYPQPNPYVPTDLKLFFTAKQHRPQSELYRQDTRIYSQVDTELEIPKGSISLSFISDEIHGDPENYLLAKLYSAAKKEELNEWGYPVKLAGLNYSISHGYNTLTVDVSGYSQHLTSLLSDLIMDPHHLRRLNHVNIPREAFDEIKKKMKRQVMNKDHDAAYQQLLYETSQFFSTSSIHYKDYVHFIDQVTLEQVNVFARKFFSEVSIRSFVYGNVEPQKVKPLVDLFFKHTQAVGFVEKEVEVFENKYLKLPEGKYSYEISGPNNNNGQITLYKASEWTIANQAMVDLIAKLCEQPYFTELRTHQQLGYVVAAFSTSNYGFCGLGTLIQSQTHGAVDCFNRSHQFLDQYLKDLNNTLTSQDLEIVKESIIHEITQKPNSLGERLARFTTMAGHYHGDFAFFDKMAQAVKKITKDHVIEFVDKNLQLMGPKANHISFLYHGSNQESSEKIEDVQYLRDYKKVLLYWERHQPYKNSKNMTM